MLSRDPRQCRCATTRSSSPRPPRRCSTRPTPLLLDYLAHDLDGHRVRLSSQALIEDATDIFFGASKWQQLQVPARFLTAEWSTGAGSAPGYPAEAVQAFRDALPGVLVAVRPVPESTMPHPS